MNKQAYLKLMGVQKKAYTDVPDESWTPQMYKDLADKTEAEVKKPQVKAAPAKPVTPIVAVPKPEKDPEQQKKVFNKFMQGIDNMKNPWYFAQKYNPRVNKDLSASMKKGFPHLITASRLSRGGKLIQGEALPVLENYALKKAYEGQSFWHRLWEFLKQKWAAVTGNYDYMSYGQRPVYMRAKTGYQNARRNLELLTGNQK